MIFLGEDCLRVTPGNAARASRREMSSAGLTETCPMAARRPSATDTREVDDRGRPSAAPRSFAMPMSISAGRRYSCLPNPCRSDRIFPGDLHTMLNLARRPGPSQPRSASFYHVGCARAADAPADPAIGRSHNSIMPQNIVTNSGHYYAKARPADYP